MRMCILSPLATILDRPDIAQLSARDESGAFAIRPGHAPFVTALPPSVLTLVSIAGDTLFAALAGGLLRVDRDGVMITSPDAAVGSDLAPLAARVEAERAAIQRRQHEDQAAERTLNAALIHHLLDSMSGERSHEGERP